MLDNVIEVDGLVKYFDGRCILDGIDLKVPRGCIYGLLGRNGSGKTTMIRILLGLEPPTRGRTFVLGQDSMKLSARTHGRIGYVAEGHHLIQSYKVQWLINLCKGLSLHWNDEFFGHLMETFRLPVNRKVKDLSAGMRAQLNHPRRPDARPRHGRPPAVPRISHRRDSAPGPDDSLQLAHSQ